jgi:hypothetical protein
MAFRPSAFLPLPSVRIAGRLLTKKRSVTRLPVGMQAKLKIRSPGSLTPRLWTPGESLHRLVGVFFCNGGFHGSKVTCI